MVKTTLEDMRPHVNSEDLCKNHATRKEAIDLSKYEVIEDNLSLLVRDMLPKSPDKQEAQRAIIWASTLPLPAKALAFAIIDHQKRHPDGVPLTIHQLEWMLSMSHRGVKLATTSLREWEHAKVEGGKGRSPNSYRIMESIFAGVKPFVNRPWDGPTKKPVVSTSGANKDPSAIYKNAHAHLNGSAIAPPPTHNGPSPTTSRPDGGVESTPTPHHGVPYPAYSDPDYTARVYNAHRRTYTRENPKLNMTAMQSEAAI